MNPDNSLLIGTVKGPGEKPNEYCFITADNSRSKIGEFVYYKTSDNRKIIGSIIDKALVRGLPESFMADATISPGDISALIGCQTDTTELFQVSVNINGYFDKDLKCFVNPRIAPDPGNKVFQVPDNELNEIINNRTEGEIGSATIGRLLTRDQSEVPVVLNVKNLVSTHLAILASTGSGKSYTAGVLVEELLKPFNRAAVLIVDPHNEYDTLKEMEVNHIFRTVDYKPKVEIFPPSRVKVRISSLTQFDIKYLLPNLSDKMEYYLSLAYKNVVRGADPDDDSSYSWGIDDLYNELETLTERYPSDEGTMNALNWRLRSRFEKSRIFSDSLHIPLNKLFAPGQCTVLQLSEIDQTEQQVIVSTILRRINKARMDTHKGNIADLNSESYIPYPVFVLIEEAHRFAPANAPSVSANILKTILSEGRKFGVGVGLITQRPGKIDSDILSQCMTQMIMKIINPFDQKTIASSVESAGTQLLNEITGLTRGQVIIAGAAINTPVLCQIRQRITSHGGDDIDAPAVWTSYFNESKQKTRQLESSVLTKVDTSEKFKGLSI